MSLKLYTLAEVSEHNRSANEKWIVMNSKVYDVTKFLSEHPGGEEVIAEVTGQDATNAFNDVGHSRDALEMAEEYLIGQVAAGSAPAPSGDSAPNVAKPGTSIKDILTSPTWTNFLIPSAIGIIVYIVYKAAIKVLA